jgi:hypothetical protein
MQFRIPGELWLVMVIRLTHTLFPWRVSVFSNQDNNYKKNITRSGAVGNKIIMRESRSCDGFQKSVFILPNWPLLIIRIE